MPREIESWEALAAHKGEVLCMGAGMVLLHIEKLLSAWDIAARINDIVDNDPWKWGNRLRYGQNDYKIKSLKEIQSMEFQDPLMLITCESDRQIMSQLNENSFFDKWNVASYPKLNRAYRKKIKPEQPEAEEQYRIPPIIHCVWFGDKAIPEEHEGYIAGWRKQCRDYEVILWNEANYDTGKCPYVREAYEAGDYARVSDYARMDILYQYGGFYMDTDVELKKSLDILRRHSAVFAYGEWPAVNSGILCGAVPGHRLIKRIRDMPRSQIHYYDALGRPDRRTNCYYENEALKEIGLRGDFTSQTINGTAIYSPSYFASKGRYFDDCEVTSETIAVHHCAGSWKRR